MATVYDVAKAANVSIATVSRVFNNNQNVSTNARDKVILAAKELNYTPHLGARSMMIKRTDTIGIVLPDMHGDFFSQLVRGIDVAARKLGLHLLVSCSHDDVEEMKTALYAMRGRVDGVIVMSPLIKSDALKELLPDDLPLLLLNGDRQIEGVPTINLDNYSGAASIANHFVEEGFRRLVMIVGPKDNIDSQQRRDGFSNAFESAEVSVSLEYVEGEFSEESGYEAGNKIAAMPILPDAIFASNDAMAIGCLCAFNECGISVPGDVALAGFDDVPMARYMIPSLTTVKVPMGEMGSQSVNTLVEKIKNPSGNGLAPKSKILPILIVRDSSRRA